MGNIPLKLNREFSFSRSWDDLVSNTASDMGADINVEGKINDETLDIISSTSSTAMGNDEVLDRNSEISNTASACVIDDQNIENAEVNRKEDGEVAECKKTKFVIKTLSDVILMILISDWITLQKNC